MEIYILSASVKDYTDPVTRSDKGQKGHGLIHKTSVCTVIQYVCTYFVCFKVFALSHNKSMLGVILWSPYIVEIESVNDPVETGQLHCGLCRKCHNIAMQVLRWASVT